MATQQPITTPQPTLNLKNIQGDILAGLPKKAEVYFFFKINDAAKFKDDLGEIVPLIKSTDQVIKDRQAIEEHRKKHPHGGHLIPLAGVNISFSAKGLRKLNISTTDIDNLGDNSFKIGQLKDSETLKDKGTGEGNTFTPDWHPEFKKDIDGVILIAGDSRDTVEEKLDRVKHLLAVPHGHVKIIGAIQHGRQASVEPVKEIWGHVRPGKVSAHEHFGFLDGVSNPAIIGFDKNPPQVPAPIQPGNIIAKQNGDSRAATRPAWAQDGSFMVFRHLFQRVPEFDRFLDEHPIVAPGLSKKDGSELRGARMVGRWKSGAPVDLTPLRDDPSLATANNFRFEGQEDTQVRCPFAAHIRKTFPRADLQDHAPGINIDNRRIMRRGIQFGPEVTEREHYEKRTHHGRGLLFTCYQSSIDDGFHFMQTSWSNNPTFPPFEDTPAVPGIDPIIGQVGGGKPRVMSGTNHLNVDEEITFPEEFVVPRGGEYFFTPSIKTLKEVFAGADRH